MLIKEALIVLFPDWSKMFWVETDASNIGIKAVLIQKNIKGKVWLSVAFAFRSLKKAKYNYSTIDKEVLIIV